MKTLRYTGGAKSPPRLDRFIQSALPGLPGGLLHKYLRQNKIKLNGKKQPLSTRLAPGDEVRLYLPQSAGENAPALPALKVLYEDAGLLAAYKPAGLISLREGPESGAEGDSLLARARAHAAGAYQPLACHRLDTGTSGVLLFAKSPEMLDFFTGLIREHRLQKLYYGLSFGHPAPPAGQMEGWLQKDAQKGLVRVCATARPGAKQAVTAYRTLATSGPLALLELEPRTGRTHQLRAQLAAGGTPLLGDSKYGDLAANRRYRCKYQCLCAAQLRFPKLPGLPEDDPRAAYSGLRISCEKPWFYQQAIDGEI